MLKKNDRIRLKITDMSVRGEGVGKYDGLALFVKDAVTGDEVLAVITKMKKGYGYAKTLEVLSASQDRVKPVCPVALRCGGCQLMQLSYDAQLKFKEGLVKNALERIGGRKEGTFYPIIPMDTEDSLSPCHFRNKLQFPVGWDGQGHVVTGFYAGRTHHIVSAVQCAVSPEVNDVIMERIRSFLERHRISAYNEETGSGTVRHVLIRNGFYTGQIMVCLVINDDCLESEALEKEFVQDLLSADLADAGNDPETGAEQTVRSDDCGPGGRSAAEDGKAQPAWKISSICLNINKKKTNVILGEEVRCIYGQPYIEEILEGCGEGMKPLTFRINPLSFFQTNPRQTATLYGKALEFADLKGSETVWDLYCGTGTISLFLAQKAGKVYGVEVIPEAIQDARENAQRNNIHNAQFLCGRSEDVFQKNAADENDLVVVLDPPRKGCDRKLLETILDAEPDRIVYVSCDPATLARDVDFLCREKYSVKKIQPVDMFPHTVHVETVVLMSRVEK